MLSEDVQDLNATENDMIKHLTEALALWERVVRFYAATDPGLAFDLVGDPPQWVVSVRQEVSAREKAVIL